MKRPPSSLATAGVHVDALPPAGPTEVGPRGAERVMDARDAHRLGKRDKRRAKRTDKAQGNRHVRRTAKQAWKPGELCTVDGEGDTAFRVREIGESGAYLDRIEQVDGRDGGLGHGREGFGKMTPLALADIDIVTTVVRRKR